MATFLAAPDEADYELDGAVLYTVGNPAPLTLSTPCPVAPDTPAGGGSSAPPRTAMVAFG